MSARSLRLLTKTLLFFNFLNITVMGQILTQEDVAKEYEKYFNTLRALQRDVEDSYAAFMSTLYNMVDALILLKMDKISEVQVHTGKVMDEFDLLERLKAYDNIRQFSSEPQFMLRMIQDVRKACNKYRSTFNFYDNDYENLNEI
jgi:hypothetical protein